MRPEAGLRVVVGADDAGYAFDPASASQAKVAIIEDYEKGRVDGPGPLGARPT